MAVSSSQLVIDSSFVLSFILPDENKAKVEKLFDQAREGKVTFIAPLLLPFEVFNGLETAVARKRISFTLAQALGEKFLKLSILLLDLDYLEVQKIANREKLTFYDASYLYLARLRKLPLLTLDSTLAKLA